MRGNTHVVGGLALGLAIAKHVPVDLEVIKVVPAIVVGSLLPDIDHQHSKISKYLMPISVLIRSIWKHRTFTHTPLFTIIIGGVTALATNDLSLTIGVITGVTSHLILDICNPTGIPLLYPLSDKKFSIMKFRTGTGEELVFITLFVLAMIGLASPIWLIRIMTEILGGV